MRGVGLLLLVTAVHCCPEHTIPEGGFALLRPYTSNMVLQAERPVLEGVAGDGVEMNITLLPPLAGSVAVKAPKGGGKWSAALPPQKASASGARIKITSSRGGVKVLDNVLFGDVWVCSGQSNMEFALAEDFNAQELIRTAGEHASLRMFAVQKNTSDAECDDLIDVQTGGWVVSSPSTVCGDEYDANATRYCLPHCGPSAAVKSFHRPTWGYFSAVCYITGLRLLTETGRPQGMLETSWGGTTIESWSPASDKCGTSLKNGPRWNGMVAPLLGVSIKGVLWYQGEANSGSVTKGNTYACLLDTMIDNWRARWQGGFETFIVAQLAANVGGGEGFMATRYSQFGVAHSRRDVGLAVLVDLLDRTSPCGAVHIRNKTTVGARMARSALALGYGREVGWTGPVPTSMVVGDEGAVSVRFTTPLRVMAATWNNQTTDPSWLGFEALTGKEWVKVSATSASLDTVRVSAPRGASHIRYAWEMAPSGSLLYDPDLLPATPFIANCSQTACELLPPGGVPTS